MKQTRNLEYDCINIVTAVYVFFVFGFVSLCFFMLVFIICVSAKEQALYFQQHSVCASRANEVILFRPNLVAYCQQITPSMAAIASE